MIMSFFLKFTYKYIRGISASDQELARNEPKSAISCKIHVLRYTNSWRKT
jgi:hypothetical protein